MVDHLAGARPDFFHDRRTLRAERGLHFHRFYYDQRLPGLHRLSLLGQHLQHLPRHRRRHLGCCESMTRPSSASLGRDKFEGYGTRRDKNRVAATRAENPGASPVHPDDRASVRHRLDLRRDLLAVNSHPRRAPAMRDNLDVEFTRAACEPQLHRRPQTSKPASPLHGDRAGEPLAPGRIPFEGPAVTPAVPAPRAVIAAAINAALSASSLGCHRGKNSSRKRVESFASANGPLATTSRKNAAVFLIPSSANSSSAATVRARACSRSSPKQNSFATRLS